MATFRTIESLGVQLRAMAAMHAPYIGAPHIGIKPHEIAPLEIDRRTAAYLDAIVAVVDGEAARSAEHNYRYQGGNYFFYVKRDQDGSGKVFFRLMTYQARGSNFLVNLDPSEPNTDHVIHEALVEQIRRVRDVYRENDMDLGLRWIRNAISAEASTRDGQYGAQMLKRVLRGEQGFEGLSSGLGASDFHSPYSADDLEYFKVFVPKAEDIRWPEWAAATRDHVIEVRPDGTDDVVLLIGFPEQSMAHTEVSAVKVGRYLFCYTHPGFTSRFAAAYGIDLHRTHGVRGEQVLPRSFFTDFALFGGPDGATLTHVRRWARVTNMPGVNARGHQMLQQAADELERSTGVSGLRGLSAAPGDVDGFIAETVDAVIVHAERAFERAGLTVDGKPLGARAWTPLFVGELGTDANADDLMLSPDRGEQTIVAWTNKDYIRHGTEDAARVLRYAWFARQFVRGATDVGFWMLSVGYRESGPETRLGLDLWRLGRNVASEIADAFDVRSTLLTTNQAKQRQERVRRGILEAVRTRLNWPALPDNFDPPPPSQWPSAE